MKSLLIATALILSAVDAQAEQICSKYCKPGVSKACGNSCIPEANQCRKSWTTACNGERPEKAKQSYATPTHVNVAPTKSK